MALQSEQHLKGVECAPARRASANITDLSFMKYLSIQATIMSGKCRLGCGSLLSGMHRYGTRCSPLFQWRSYGVSLIFRRASGSVGSRRRRGFSGASVARMQVQPTNPRVHEAVAVGCVGNMGRSWSDVVGFVRDAAGGINGASPGSVWDRGAENVKWQALRVKKAMKKRRRKERSRPIFLQVCFQGGMWVRTERWLRPRRSVEGSFCMCASRAGYLLTSYSEHFCTLPHCIL